MNQNYTEIPQDVKELLSKIQQDSKVYIYNLMTEPGKDYTEDEYNSMKQTIRESALDKENGVNPFAVFTDEEMQTNIMTAVEGYGGFGHEFIINLVDKDPASAKVILEAVMQDYLDLQAFMDNYINSLQAQVQQAQAKEETTETKTEE